MSTSGSEQCLTELTIGEIIGLTISSEAALLSMLAVFSVFLYILSNIVRNILYPPQGGWNLIRGPLDIYVISLLASDFLQGLGAAMNLKWIHLHFVTCSAYCSAQGIIGTMGETGSALATIAITLHTFIKVVFQRKLNSLWVARGVVISIWIFCTFLPLGNYLADRHSSNPFITPAPFWCWIGSKYPAQRKGGEYVWLWSAALISVLYIPLVFIVRGNIDIHPQKWWKIRIRLNRKDSVDDEDEEDEDEGTIYLMLLCPIIYSVLVVPLSILRWIEFKNVVISDQATFAVYTLFSLMGLANVLMLKYLRPDMLLMGRE